jgi:hypothetical protein
MRRILVAGVVAALLAAASCDDAPADRPCSDIPPGGCPLSHGVACEDPSCEAIYACRQGNVWELAERCPAREAGAPVAVDASVDGADASPPPPKDAAIDAPPGAWGGPGCPSLQAPDCSLGLALACPSGCCGCEDLFVCENAGWTLWGTCGDGGIDRGFAPP